MGQPLTLDEVGVAPEDAAQVIYDLRRKVEALEDQPNGWMIAHHRAAGSSTLHFGPFVTMGDVEKWMRDVGEPNRVSGLIIPLYRTVDWSR